MMRAYNKPSQQHRSYMSQKSLIHLLGLRDYFDKKEQRVKKKHEFYTKGWRASSVGELFTNIDQYINEIPEAERVNLYYTAANCFEKAGRKMDYQHVLPIDVDGINRERFEEYVPIICDSLQIQAEETGIVFTGNGLQFIIGLQEPITYDGYFDEHRVYYKALCDKLQDALKAAHLEGDVDTSVFSPARLLRLPNTLNSKPDKGEHKAFLMQATIKLVDFDLIERSGIPIVDPSQQISPLMLDHLPPPDTEGVLEGCDFLKHCKENAESIDEPSWYAMLSVIGRLEAGKEIAHEYSQPHPNYNPYETDRKLQQAIETAGPRTCENINSLWDGCASCPNWGKCKSPVTLQSATYIQTKDTGFYNVSIDANGNIKKGKPNYDDLLMYWEKQNPYITMEESNITYIYASNYWVDISPKYIDSFAEEYFDPSPTNAMCSEFRGKMQRTNLRPSDWFEVRDKLNFKNGVLDLETMELEPSNKDYGFKYSLPFDYDPDQKAPRFERFLDEVTLSDEALKQVLLEFMGYSLSGIDANVGQKALILSGDGSNGKSVFMDLLKYMAGEGNYSTLSMGKEITRLENRYQLDGKLFNISEETPTNAMIDNSIFKALVTGGEVQARKLYCDAYSMKNTAKIIMACNELPSTQDLSYGMLRRLLIAPFNATFTKHIEGFDPFIRDKLISEASGIYNLVIDALKTFKKNKGFSESITIDDEIETYRMKNDSILSFAESCLIRDNQAMTSFAKMYLNYRMYCEAEGIKPEAKNKFSSKIKSICKETVTHRKRIEGRIQVVIQGYRLGTKEDDDAVQAETI